MTDTPQQPPDNATPQGPSQPDHASDAESSQPEARATATHLPQGGETSRAADSTPALTAPFVQLPVQFGRYQVRRLLGSGAMGAVYLADDTQLERAVALKVPKISKSGSEKLLQRMKTEAKALAKLDHPHICKVYDFDVLNGIHFIAMEYIEGEELKAILKRVGKKRKPAEAVQIIIQLARALKTAHANGVIHRDLKPENIMRKRDGRLVIMDFGLARQTQISKDAERTQGGTILGSAAYMSPEQASGRPELVDPRSDIYSLGAMLFEMLTGEWPFVGNSIEIMGQKATQPPPSPLSFNPSLPPQLADICQKMIGRKLGDRYSSCDEVIAALRSVDLTESLKAPNSGTKTGKPSSVEAGKTAATLIDPAPLDFLKDAEDERIATLLVRTQAGQLPGKRRTHFRLSRIQIALLLAGLIGSILLAVLFLPTRYGVLKIEIEDPSLAVKFDDQSITVENDGQPIRIKPTSKHTLVVQQNGVTVDGGTREIALSKGEKERQIVVSLIDGQVAIDGKVLSVLLVQPGATADEEQQRRVAEWLHSIGATIEGKTASMPWISVGAGDSLPEEHFRIQIIKIYNKRNISTRELSTLVHLPELWGLYIKSTKLEDTAAEALAQLSRLRVLTVDETGLSGKALKALARLPVLVHLGIDNQQLADFQSIGDFSRLQVLSVHAESTTNLPVVENSTGLRDIYLDIARTPPSAELVAQLQQHNPNLRVIIEQQGKRTIGRDPCHAAIAQLLPRGIEIRATVFPPPSAPSKDLTLADLGDQPWIATRMTIPSALHLTAADCDAISRVHFQGAWFIARNQSIPAPLIKAIRRFEFGKVDLNGCPINDDALADLKQLLVVNTFDLRNTQLTKRSIDELSQALPGCEILSNFGSFKQELSTSGQATLEPDSHQDPDREVAEWVLSLGGSVGCSTDTENQPWMTVTSKDALPESHFNVEIVSLTSVSRFRSADIENLARLPRLNILYLAHTSLDASASSKLSKLPRLSNLSIAYSGIPATALAPLAELRGLIFLEIDAVQGVNLGALAKLSALRVLTISNANDATLKNLGSLPQLSLLRLGPASSVTEEAVAKLQQQNPHLNVAKYLGSEMQKLATLGANRQQPALKQLHDRGVNFTVQMIPGTGPALPLTETLLDEPEPLFVWNTTVPASLELQREDIVAFSQVLLSFALVARNNQQIELLIDGIRDQPCLRSLNLSDSPLSDEALSRLSGLANLIAITIQNTKVTREGVWAFHRSLPACRIISDFGTIEPDYDAEPGPWELRPVSSAPSPQSVPADPDREVAEWVLSIGGRVNLKTSLPPGPVVVDMLDFTRRPAFKSADLDRFARLKHLRFLWLSGTSLDGTAPERIANLTTVRQLAIEKSGIPGDTIALLTQLQCLTSLSIDHQQLGDIEKSASFPSLRSLYIDDATIEDLRRLDRFSGLLSLRFGPGSLVSEPEILELQKQRPHLRVAVDNKRETLVVGTDPQRETIGRLFKKGVTFRIATTTHWNVATPHLLNEEDLKARYPFNTYNVTVPTTFDTDDDDVESLRYLLFSHLNAEGCSHVSRLLEAIKQNTDLQSVDVSASDIQDKDLNTFVGFPNLGYFDVRQTQVSREAIERFHRSFPRCKIQSDFGTIEPDYDAEPAPFELPAAPAANPSSTPADSSPAGSPKPDSK